MSRSRLGLEAERLGSRLGLGHEGLVSIPGNWPTYFRGSCADAHRTPGDRPINRSVQFRPTDAGRTKQLELCGLSHPRLQLYSAAFWCRAVYSTYACAAGKIGCEIDY